MLIFSDLYGSFFIGYIVIIILFQFSKNSEIVIVFNFDPGSPITTLFFLKLIYLFYLKILYHS